MRNRPCTIRSSMPIIIGLLTSFLSANVYYVDKNHAQANDINAGTSLALPWKTLAKAGNTAQAGDTVLVKAGTYNENLTPMHSGTPGSMVVFKAYPGDECVDAGTDKTCKVIIMGQVYFRDGNDDATLKPNGLSYIRIEGFEIIPLGVGVRLQNAYYDPGSRSTGIEIINNYIHNPRGSCGGSDGNCDGISAGYVKNCTFMNNAISRMLNNGTGIFVGGYLNGYRSKNILIKNNRITDNSCDGIRPYGDSIFIVGNTLGFTSSQYFTGCHQDGIEIYGPNNGLFIINNTISDFTQNIYPSAEHAAGYNIENVYIIGNCIYNRIRDLSSYTKGVFGGGSTAKLKNVYIIGNTFYNNYFGISCGVDSGVMIIRNNIVARSNTSLGQNSKAGTTVSSDYNLYYLHTGDVIAWGGWFGTVSAFQTANRSQEQHSVEVDPQFVDSAVENFRLKSTSPARDAGDPNLASVVTLPSPYVDIDGHARPQGTRYDMGAYEYVSSGAIRYKSSMACGNLPLVVRPDFLQSGITHMDIQYKIALPGNVRLTIYNARGETIWQSAEGIHQPGTHHAVWDGKNASSRSVEGGIYYLKVNTPDKSFVKQFAVVR
jgi:hypothetical protein